MTDGDDTAAVDMRSARRSVRKRIVSNGLFTAAFLLAVGVATRYFAGMASAWVAIPSVFSAMVMGLVAHYEDAAPVGSKPRHRTVWTAAVLTLAAYVAAAAVTLVIWSAIGWWAGR